MTIVIKIISPKLSLCYRWVMHNKWQKTKGFWRPANKDYPFVRKQNIIIAKSYQQFYIQVLIKNISQTVYEWIKLSSNYFPEILSIVVSTPPTFLHSSELVDNILAMNFNNKCKFSMEKYKQCQPRS